MAVAGSSEGGGLAQPDDAGTVIPSENTEGKSRPWRRVRVLSDTTWRVVLMLLVVAMSGDPALATPGVAKILVPVVAVVLGFLVFSRKTPKGAYRVGPFLALFGVVIAIQSVHFMMFPVITMLGLICRFFVAYCLVVLVPDFAATYIKVMLGVAILAMFFYFANLAGSAAGIDVAGATKPLALPVATNEGSWTFLLHSYSVNPTDATRNAGMFWEPGALAGYVSLALVFLCLSRSVYTKRGFLVRFLILATCILTTESTMGYIAFVVVMLLAGMSGARHSSRSKFVPILVSLCALGLFAFLGLSQDFIIPKIQNSIMQSTMRTDAWQADRLGSILFDLDYISARPLTGWGISDVTRLAMDQDLEGGALTGRGNGMSDYAAKFGIPALLMWLFLVFNTFLRLSRGARLLAALGTLVVFVMLNDECFLNYPLFLTFFFSAGFGDKRLGPSLAQQLKVVPSCPK
jgi:hypothetical protein